MVVYYAVLLLPVLTAEALNLRAQPPPDEALWSNWSTEALEYERWAREVEDKFLPVDDLYRFGSERVRCASAAQSGETIEEGAAKLLDELSRFDNKHVVFVGDSVSRYQYLNMAYHLTHREAPNFQFFAGAFLNHLQHQRREPKHNYFDGWTKYYNETNRILQTNRSSEVCDCYRLECCSDTVENRFFEVPGTNTHLTNIQWMKWSFKGHWSPSNGYPIDAKCAAGSCAPPFAWEIDRTDTSRLISEVVMKLKPTPTHVMFNQAIWGMLDNATLTDLAKAGQEVSLKTGTKFIWKTSTRDRDALIEGSKLGRINAEKEIMTKFGWQILDLYDLMYACEGVHMDMHHVTEMANSYFNHKLAQLI